MAKEQNAKNEASETQKLNEKRQRVSVDTFLKTKNDQMKDAWLTQGLLAFRSSDVSPVPSIDNQSLQMRNHIDIGLENQIKSLPDRTEVLQLKSMVSLHTTDSDLITIAQNEKLRKTHNQINALSFYSDDIHKIPIPKKEDGAEYTLYRRDTLHRGDTLYRKDTLHRGDTIDSKDEELVTLSPNLSAEVHKNKKPPSKFLG